MVDVIALQWFRWTAAVVPGRVVSDVEDLRSR
jgi:hypothetical protein